MWLVMFSSALILYKAMDPMTRACIVLSHFLVYISAPIERDPTAH